MQKREIIEYALFLKKYYNSNDPFLLATNLGIETIIRDCAPTCMTAHTIKMNHLPIIIFINGRYHGIQAKLLCAHELAHALFHDQTVNYFSSPNASYHAVLEQEANLFAIALLLSNEEKIDLYTLSGYELNLIMEYNLMISNT